MDDERKRVLSFSFRFHRPKERRKRIFFQKSHFVEFYKSIGLTNFTFWVVWCIFEGKPLKSLVLVRREIHWINLSSGLFGKHQKSKKYTGFHKIQWIFYLTFFEKKLDKKIQESAGFYFFGFRFFNMVIRYDFTSIDTKRHTYKPIGKLISFSFGKIKKQNTLDNIIQWNIFIHWIILSSGYFFRIICRTNPYLWKRHYLCKSTLDPRTQKNPIAKTSIRKKWVCFIKIYF